MCLTLSGFERATPRSCEANTTNTPPSFKGPFKEKQDFSLSSLWDTAEVFSLVFYNNLRRYEEDKRKNKIFAADFFNLTFFFMWTGLFVG